MLLHLAQIFERRSSPWAGRVVRFNNGVVDFWQQRMPRAVEASTDPIRNAIRSRSVLRTDISDHLESIYLETLVGRPQLIVELGTRGGESTQALQAAAEQVGATMVSIDIDDCSEVCSYAHWHFVHDDDIHFAGIFGKWCKQKDLRPQIDVLFVDTSHQYEHTVAEISHWFPLLSPKCKVMFHDTNMACIYSRRDGSFGPGWDNQRGVIRAIEEFLGTRIKETRAFETSVNGWRVRHVPYCNGFTVLERG
jgi:cephalosporin hydroxylase